MLFEGVNLEYKREWTDDIIPEIVSFLNCTGGTLFIGVSDDGTVYGVDDPDALLTRIANKVHDCISPPASVLVFPDVLEDKPSGKHIVCCRVGKGSKPPYYVKQSGILKGVYIRSGASKLLADEETVRNLIRESDPVAFESLTSPRQELSFSYVSMIFEKNGMEFGEVQKRSLGLIDPQGVYTNLALWLSDQCPHFIKAAAFEGNDLSEFKQRAEITGSLLMQFDSAIQFVANNNTERMVIDPKTMQRLEFRKFPEIAVRESILNALMHRDYSLPHATQLKIFSDRLELVSFGSILPELLPEDIGSGISACRNEKLANFFYRLHLVEAYGTGIPKIYKEYSAFASEPQITVGKGTFKIMLPAKTLPNYDEIFGTLR